MATFTFRFSHWHRVLGALFGITPNTTVVEIAGNRLTARFGPWVLETTLANVGGVAETGPFTLFKTAGPARLSLADRGLTMATNSDRGVCIRFKTPVRGIDPFGLIRHPGLTITVERVDELRRAIEDGGHSGDPGSMGAGIPELSPWKTLRRWGRWPAGMALAVARYLASVRTVQRSFETRSASPPEPEEGDDSAGLQPMDRGVGAAYARIYRVTIVDTDLTPEQLLDRVASNFNGVTPTEVTEFVTAAPQEGEGAAGQEYRIRMPGPWDARVRVLDRGPTTLRLATLKGHMEAGEIEFSTRPGEDLGCRDAGRSLVFEIRSIARSGDRVAELLYRVLSLGKQMQEHMWVHMCGRVVIIAEGRQHGSIAVHTIRYAR